MAQRTMLRTFLLNSLASVVGVDISNLKSADPSRKGLVRNNYLTRTLIQTLCKTTKLLWPASRDIIDDVVQFLNASRDHAMLGLRLLRGLVLEFEPTGPGSVDAASRLAANSFREQGALTKAFQLSLQFVQTTSPANDVGLLTAALQSLLACLSYDFVGTGADDSDDGVACVYIPGAWAEHIARPKALEMLFSLYEALWKHGPAGDVEQPATLCLECLVLLAACRRSVFDRSTRRAFLAALLAGTRGVMVSKVGLANSDACSHQVCRLLSRIKCHFQLSELVASAPYKLWLEQLAAFTIEALHSWRSVSSRSTHYLMSLWAALVLPTPYLQLRDSGGGGRPGAEALDHNLRAFVPQVVRGFVESRCELAAAAALEEIEIGGAAESGDVEDVSGFTGFGAGFGAIEENPLEDESMLLEHLAPVPVLARYQFGETARVIGGAYNAAFAQIGQGSSPKDLVAARAKLTFLTYMIGAIVGGHVSRVAASAVERLHETNAELAALVFRMVMSDASAASAHQSLGSSGWRLEFASLYFFQCFQNLYIEYRAREDAEAQENRRRQRALAFLGDRTGRRKSGSQSDGGGGRRNRRHSFEEQRESAKVAPLPRAKPSLGRFDADDDDDDDDIKSLPDIKSQQQMDEGHPLQQSPPSSVSPGEAKIQQVSIAGQLGISGGDRALLDVVMQRIFGILQHAHNYKSDSRTQVDLVSRALAVFYQLSVGVTIVHAGHSYTPRLISSGRLLLESGVIQDLLVDPRASRFPLLDNPKHGRARTFLMATLSNLLFTKNRHPPIGGDRKTSSTAEIAEGAFNVFMKPITETADTLLQRASLAGNLLRNEELKAPIVGMLRDLRGVAASATATKEFDLLLAWLIPARMPLLTIIASSWADAPSVIVPLLKFLLEVVTNKGSRIVFPSNSPGGIILCRDTCAVLNAYMEPRLAKLSAETAADGRDAAARGHADSMSMDALREAVMAMGDAGEGEKRGEVTLGRGVVGKGATVDMESVDVKCARLCALCLHKLLVGRYANFGVFDLYRDGCLKEALRRAVLLAFAGSPGHVMGFPKMAKAALCLLQSVSDKMVYALVDIPTPAFVRIMACLADALSSSDAKLSTPASHTLSSIATFRCHALARSTDASAPISLARARAMGMTTLTYAGSFSAAELEASVQHFATHQSSHPKLFGELLAVCFDRLLSPSSRGAVSNMWSLARPVLPLVLCCPRDFMEYRGHYLSTQTPERQARLSESLDKLFAKVPAAVDPSTLALKPDTYNDVLAKNEAFTKDLSMFCRILRRDRI